REDCAFLERSGETYLLSTMTAYLARIVREQGRDEEALALTLTAEKSAAEDDVDAQMLWRSIRAPILARAGDCEHALELARSAVALARDMENPVALADALRDLACVLRQSGLGAEARVAADEATTIYAAKGDVVSAARDD